MIPHYSFEKITDHSKKFTKGSILPFQICFSNPKRVIKRFQEWLDGVYSNVKRLVPMFNDFLKTKFTEDFFFMEKLLVSRHFIFVQH